MKPTSIRNILVILTLAVLSFGVGYRQGNKGKITLPNSENVTLTKTTQPSGQNIDFSLFWDVWSRLSTDYIDKKMLEPQKMVYGAITGMVQSLGDPYTVFLPPSENKDSKDSLGGHFEGIGAQLGVEEKKIIVVAPLKGTPAEKAGLRPGDWILKVDGKDTVNWTLPQTVTAIRGPRGTKVALSVLHKNADKAVDISVLRDTIKVPSVEWSMKTTPKGNVVYLKLSQFGDTTNDEWNKVVGEIDQAIRSDNSGKIKGMVLDLRNNPGGYLSSAVYIASEFIKEGVVVTQENADGSKNNFTVARRGKLLSTTLLVLLNKGSASASEIVSGAIQDLSRGKLVGDHTYGKGTIQDVQDLPKGAGLHITVAKWLTPNGRWVHGKGLTPDVVIANDDKKPDEDAQLNKALDLLTK